MFLCMELVVLFAKKYLTRCYDYKFWGIPEGTCDFIEDEVSLPIDIFRTIYDYCNNEVRVDNHSDNNSWGCSIEFISNEEIVEEFGDGKLDYDKFTEILYYIVNTHAEDLSQYLW